MEIKVSVTSDGMLSTTAGVSKVSTAVEVSTTSTSTLPTVSSKGLEESAFVEALTTSDSGGGVGGVAGGRGSDGVGLDLQKKFLEPRALKSRP